MDTSDGEADRAPQCAGRIHDFPDRFSRPGLVRNAEGPGIPESASRDLLHRYSRYKTVLISRLAILRRPTIVIED